jgi:hypothetical protein
MSKVYSFLGISKDINVNLNKRYNVGGKRWKNKKSKNFFMKDNWVKSILKSITPKEIRQEIRNKLVNLSTKEVEEMKKETRKMLNNYFQEDIKNLSELLNKDLQHWTK